MEYVVLGPMQQKVPTTVSPVVELTYVALVLLYTPSMKAAIENKKII